MAEDFERVCRAEAVEAAAWADSYDAAAGGDLGAATARVADATLMRMAKLPAAFFCRVLGLGLDQPADAATVRAILAWYADAGFSDLWIQASPLAQPDGLDGLRGAGLAPAGRGWGTFIRDAVAPAVVPTDLEIVEIGADRAEDFAATTVEGFGLPPFLAPWVRLLPGRAGWRVYVAYDGDEPAAGAATFIRDGAAWFGFDATWAAFRRRGGQSALQARRIADALAAGCDVLTTETGVDEGAPGPSWRNIERAGFRPLYIRPNYTHPPG